MINDICLHLEPYVKDLGDIKNILYIVCNNYEITSRCTEVAVINGDRNEELLKRFLIAKTVKGCTKRTIKYYGETIKKTLEEIGKTVDEITADDIRYFMAVRQRRDRISKTTIGNEIRNLGSFFQWLYAEELIRKNPMTRVDRVKQDKTQKEALTDMEIERIRMAACGEREKAIIELLLSTGCRVTELVNIMLSEIDGNRVLVHGKGCKDRYVYLNARAELAVEVYLEARTDRNPYLFPRGKSIAKMERRGIGQKDYCDWWKNADNVVDGHSDASSIESITRKIAKKAGVERANPHKFRRTCATMALRRGMPIEQVSKMLGHVEISTTQIYLDLSEDDLALAHKKYVV